MRTMRLFLLVFLSAGAGTLFAMDPLEDVPGPPAPVNFTAVASGAWSAGSTWAGGQVPGDDAIVDIPLNITVTLSGTSARIRWIQVFGTLALSSDSSSQLFVETIVVHDSGLFTLDPFLPQLKTAEVISPARDRSTGAGTRRPSPAG